MYIAVIKMNIFDENNLYANSIINVYKFLHLKLYKLLFHDTKSKKRKHISYFVSISNLFYLLFRIYLVLSFATSLSNYSIL